MSQFDNDDMRAKAHELLSAAMPSSLSQTGGALFELFTSLKEGGFTEFQSLWIIGYVVTGGANPPEESP